MPSLFKNSRAYFGYFIISIKDNLAYKLDFLLSIGFRIATAIVMLLVWTAIYLNSHITEINGFTLGFIYVYFFIFSAINIIVSPDISPTMSDDVNSGSVSTSMIRPTNYVLQVFSSGFGANFLWMLFVSIPLLLVINLFVHIPVTPFILLVFIIELILGMAVLGIIDFLFGTLSVYLTNIWGIVNVGYTIINLLGGGIIPITFFPSNIANVLLLLPFSMYGFTEIATLLSVISINQIIISILATLFWTALLYIFARLWWKRVIKKVSAIGG